jgi:DNA-binding GntR family transcriptional regulator
MDRSQLDDLFEFRLLVEPHLAMRAAGSISAEALGRLIQITKAPTSSHDAFAQVDAEFHRTLAEEAGNSLLAESLNRLHIHVHIFRSCFHAKITQEAFREHLEIMRAISARNGKAAGLAMKEHIERSYKRLCKFIEE